MNRIQEFQARVGKQGKTILGYTTDWVEWSARKNLAIADDFADFAVSQMRLPVEANDFADYRASVRDAYSEFGNVLTTHGEDFASKLKGIPEDVRALFAPRKNAAKKAAAKPGATKSKSIKKKAGRKTTATRAAKAEATS